MILMTYSTPPPHILYLFSFQRPGIGTGQGGLGGDGREVVQLIDALHGARERREGLVRIHTLHQVCGWGGYGRLVVVSGRGLGWELTNQDLSVGVSEDIEVVAMSGVIAVLHQASDLPLSIPSDVALGTSKPVDQAPPTGGVARPHPLTFMAAVPAYCLLTMSPLLAHIS